MRKFLLILMLLSAGSAAAATITFEEFSTEFGYYTYLESGGFSLTSSLMAVLEPGVGGAGPGNTLGMFGNVTIDSLSGENFAVSSLDLFGIAGSSLELIGSLAGGGIIQNTVTFTTSGLQTVVLDSAWNNLESFQLANVSQKQADNIVISTVPVPAAVWLFGSALAALGWARRKQLS